MPAEDAVRMLSELYWCAYGDIQDMPKPEPQDDEPGVRYFNQYEIMFSLGASELSADELEKDYEFYCNLYAHEATIWWGNPGGGASGGPLYSFLNIVRTDNNYAFGPTKTQKGWSSERLSKVKAVGVYKRKEAQIKVASRKSGRTKK